MLDALKKLFKLDEGEIVKYSDLEKVEPGMWICLSTERKVINIESEVNGVWYKKLSTKASNQLIFLTRIYKGCGYHVHQHDCKETITPTYGSAIINSRQILEENEMTTFYKMTNHTVFYKDSPNDKYIDIFVEFSK